MENRSDGSADLRLRAAVESSPSGLLMVDVEGRIVLVNREIERLFGYPREEMLGRPVEMLVPERLRGQHADFRASFVSEPSARAMGSGRDLSGVRKDGSEFPLEIGLTPVATEEGLFVVGSVVDLAARLDAEAERRSLEEQLQQARKMEAVGRLASGIAHDFNNILGAIIGFAELAREGVDGPASSDIDAMLEAAERGRDLIDRILRFSRHEVLDLRPIDLGDTVRDAIRLLRPTLPPAIEIGVEIEEGSSKVLADSTSVHQVVMNLVTNAAHAMPVGGRLTVRTTPFYVRDGFARARPDLSEGTYARLSVVDSGSGMDADTVGRAVEPFFTTKAPGRGSGLGLATVHTILRDHGGALWIESQPGQGTAVHCLLRIAEQEEPERAEAAAEAPAGRGEAILMVDDEPALVDTGRRRLQALGYRVETAGNAREALERLERAPRPFDLVISDLSMPLMDGVELARELNRRWPDVPVVLVTGSVEEIPSAQLEQLGIRTFLLKPLTTLSLGTAVRAVLDEDEVRRRSETGRSTSGEDDQAAPS